MKLFIKELDIEHREFESTPFAMQFRTKRDDIGHIQRSRPSWTSDLEWAIFFNSKCVHVSKGLDSAVKKLEKLGVQKSDLFF